MAYQAEISRDNPTCFLFVIGQSGSMDGDEIRDTHPYSGPEQFDQRPQLLSTSPDRNSFLSDIVLQDDLYAHWTFSSLRKPALLCMTDALGQWVLSLRAKRPSPISILRAIAKPRDSQNSWNVKGLLGESSVTIRHS
jgi:hypothetical protein